MKKDFKKWNVLWTNYMLFVCSALLLFLVPPMKDQILADVPMNDVQLGWMQGIYALPAVLFALVGGSLLDRVDSRKAGIVAGLLMLIGNVIFNFVPSFWIMLFARFVIGTGSIMINLVAGKMITVWFPRHQRGRAMSILMTAWPIAAALAFTTFVNLGIALGWQGTTLLTSLLTAASTAAFFVLVPRDSEKSQAQPSRERIGLKQLKELPPKLWVTAIIWLCFTATMMSLMTFGGSFLELNGLKYNYASFIIGLLMWVSIPASLIAGFIIDRIGNLKFYIMVPTLICGLCLFGFAYRFDPIIMVSAVGFIAAFIPISVYAMPGLMVQPYRLGLAFGVILTFSNLGNTLGPVLAGWFNTLSEKGLMDNIIRLLSAGSDFSGNKYFFSMIFSAGLMILGAVLALFLGSYRLAKSRNENTG